MEIIIEKKIKEMNVIELIDITKALRGELTKFENELSKRFSTDDNCTIKKNSNSTIKQNHL